MREGVNGKVSKYDECKPGQGNVEYSVDVEVVKKGRIETWAE
jgi:hypothetical protein